MAIGSHVMAEEMDQANAVPLAEVKQETTEAKETANAEAGATEVKQTERAEAGTANAAEAESAATRNLSVDVSKKPAGADSVVFTISEFAIEGNTLYSTDELRDLIKGYLGATRTMVDVRKAADAIQDKYKAAGYPVIKVAVPEQTLVDGKVKLNVVEGRIAAVDVEGNQAYSAQNIRNSLPALREGELFNANELEAAIAMANENGAKQVAVNIQPAAAAGDINARIDVTEDKVTRFMESLDNTGNSQTGYSKWGLAYQNANLFDQDHALTLQYSGSPSMLKDVYSFNGVYHMPVYEYRASVDVIAAYSSSNTTTPSAAGNLFFAGKGVILGERVNFSLPSINSIQHKAIVGIDYKDTNNNFTGCTNGCGSISEVPFSLGYFMQADEAELKNSISVSWLKNIPGGKHGSTAFYRQTRFQYPTLEAKPTWSLFRLNATGAVALPADWQFRAQLNAQYSRDLLIPAEQFGIGGAFSVRGYPERVLAGDIGQVGNLEVYTPELREYLGADNASLRLLAFMDAGKVKVNDLFPAGMPTTTNIYSLGMGARFGYSRDISSKLDIGWAKIALPNAVPKPIKRNDVAAHFSIIVMF